MCGCDGVCDGGGEGGVGGGGGVMCEKANAVIFRRRR